MNHPPFLCTGTLGRGPWDEKARAASEAGFARLSIYGWEHRKLHERGWDDAAIRSLLDDLNLRVAEYDGVVMSMRSPDGANDAVAKAASLGARSITVLEHSDWDPGEHLDQAAATLAEIADQSADHDILALIEPFAWSPLNHHRVAAEIVERANRHNAGLLLDTWHLWRGPEQGRLDPAVDPAVIKAIQVGDTGPAPAKPQTGDELNHECIHHRLMPGEGHGNIAELLADLAKRGVNAPLAIEVFSDELNALKTGEIARQSMASFERLTATLGP